MNKYKAEPTIVDGIRFASKREAKHYADLKYARMAGELLWFIRQPSFDLPGGVIYRADFLEIWKDGRIVVTDVKGFQTPVYRLKKRQVESLYRIKIAEV